MSQDHESWLKQQGVGVTNVTLRHRAAMDRFGYHTPNEPVEWAPQIVMQDKIYHLQVHEKTIQNWQHNERKLRDIMEYAERIGNIPASYFLDQSTRHRELLADNQMYREAWKEFQTIRTLLGERANWP